MLKTTYIFWPFVFTMTLFMAFFHKANGTLLEKDALVQAIDLNEEVSHICLQDYALFLSVHNDYLEAEKAWNRKNDFVSWENFKVTNQENEIWIYFSIKNTTTKTKEFFVNGQLTDYIALYRITDNVPQEISHSGYLIPYDKRPIKDWGMIISDTLTAETSQTYLFKLRSVTRNSRYAIDYALLGCAKLYSYEGYTNNYRQNLPLQYFFTGALFIMFIYNLCISVFTMYREYLLFSLYHAVTLLTRFFLNDLHLDTGLLPAHDYFRNISYICFAMMPVSYLMFSMKYLDIKSHMPRFHRIIKLIVLLNISVFVALIFSYFTIAYFLTLGFSIINVGLILYTAFRIVFMGIRSARFLLAGIFLTTTIAIFHNINLINWITPAQLVVITTLLHILEIVLFSFAVAYKLRESKQTMHEMRQQNELQAEKIRLEAEMRKKLEIENNQKSRSLTTASIRMLNFNEKLSDIINSIDKKTTAGKKLIKKIEELRGSDNQWEIIKGHFSSVHPGFFKQIERAFPHLSENDHKLLAFIKMKLSNKEIALILNVTRGAVEQAKRRLKKKLGMESSQGDFLKFIEDYRA